MSGLDFDAIRMRQERERFGTPGPAQQAAALTLAAETEGRTLLQPGACPNCGDDDAWIVSFEEVGYVSYPLVGIDAEQGDVVEDELRGDKSDEASFYPEMVEGSKHDQVIRCEACWHAFLPEIADGAVTLTAIDDANTEYNGH